MDSPRFRVLRHKVEDTNALMWFRLARLLGAPHWDMYARGTIVGLTRGANKNHIIRATLESLAFQTYDVLNAMQEDSGIKLAALKVDGGACANNLLMQFQADIIDAPVLRPVCIETTAMGASYLAGLAVGYWTGKADVVLNWAVSREFKPSMDAAKRAELLKGWKRAVGRALKWIEA